MINILITVFLIEIADIRVHEEWKRMVQHSATEEKSMMKECESGRHKEKRAQEKR